MILESPILYVLDDPCRVKPIKPSSVYKLKNGRGGNDQSLTIVYYCS